MSIISKLFRSKSSSDLIADRVIAEGLTYLGKQSLLELANAVKAVEAAKIVGAIVEAGCALGGSSIVLARTKAPNRKLYVYDVFGTIPSPGDKDPDIAHDRYQEIIEGRSSGIGGDLYYGYQPSLLDKVKENFLEFNLDPERDNVSFIQGLYEESMLIDYPVALAHIDCDWYDSVYVCLDRIVKNTVSGSLLIIDDYYYWPGCKKAVDDFFSEKLNEFDFIESSRLHIRKK